MTDLVEEILKSCNYEEEVTRSNYTEERKYKTLIRNTFADVEIDKVEKLNNKYLYAAFMLRKCEKENYKIIELIHSTAAENVKSIEEENLNWRLVQRAKYGFGVSFSHDADYANYHSSWSGGSRRAFVICDVLVDSKEHTNSCNEAPSGDHDTVQSTNEFVIVKFDDFTFYPKYALYYEKPSRTLSNYYRPRW